MPYGDRAADEAFSVLCPFAGLFLTDTGALISAVELSGVDPDGMTKLDAARLVAMTANITNTLPGDIAVTQYYVHAEGTKVTFRRRPDNPIADRLIQAREAAVNARGLTSTRLVHFLEYADPEGWNGGFVSSLLTNLPRVAYDPDARAHLRAMISAPGALILREAELHERADLLKKAMADYAAKWSLVMDAHALSPTRTWRFMKFLATLDNRYLDDGFPIQVPLDDCGLALPAGDIEPIQINHVDMLKLTGATPRYIRFAPIVRAPKNPIGSWSLSADAPYIGDGRLPYTMGQLDLDGARDIPAGTIEDIDDLVATARAALANNLDRRQVQVVHDSHPFRVTGTNSLAGPVLVLRRAAYPIPALTDFGLPLSAMRTLEQFTATSGLVLLIGKKRVRKTTLAAAAFAHHLAGSNGVGVTIERPPELRLEGRHGERGHCYQLDVGPHDVGSAIGDVLGLGDTRLLFGEISTPAAAAAALRCSVQGHPVLATIHGDSLLDGLFNLLALAQEDESRYAHQLLAAGLAAACRVSPVNRFGRREARFAETLWVTAADALAIRMDLRKDLMGINNIIAAQQRSAERGAG
jgi:Tfp pilus assembly pilus retraction ATPase PilT